MNQPTKVLLIESRAEYGKYLEALLAVAGDYRVEWVITLDEAIGELKENEYDVVLADLMLGDAGGHEVVQQLMVQSTTVPIVALMESITLALGKEIIGHGAQDYLSLEELSIASLQKAIHYSIERENLTKHLKGLSMKDELTGLYNRRGFRSLGEQQLKVTERTKRPCSFLFIDLDNLKTINDSNGHESGDLAIKDISEVLAKTLRNTDIIGRFGGDEFVVLAPETDYIHAKKLVDRLQDEIARRNVHVERPYILSASIGVVSYTGKPFKKMSELQAEACELMYREKRTKKESRK